MGLKIGIVGLPNVGKSTIFNALTAAGAAAANYPFCTIDPNVGVVALPDPRLDRLAAMFRPKKVTPAMVEFVDIAGLVKGASKGEGLGNQFLGHIREVEAIAHVVRCFEDPDVVHVAGPVDPARDIEIIETELMLADLEGLERRLQKVERAVKAGDKKAAVERDLVRRLIAALSAGKSVRTVAVAEEERLIVKDLFLLSAKPILYAANVGESDVTRAVPAVEAVREIAAREEAAVVVLSGRIEAELATLAEDERGEFLASMGLAEPGLNRLAREAFRLLGLISFFTVGEDECRAWPVRAGTPAVEAAGEIHSDIARGFIRAEVMSYEDLIARGSETAVREAGLLRIEGKGYEVRDGDVVHFRFNV